MKILLLFSLFINPLYTQDIEGCLDSNALNCDNNPQSFEEDADGEWWFHCETCPDEPCDGFYNPAATIDDNSCQYNQVPTWEEMVFTPTSGQIHIDWSAFEPPFDDINTFAVQRCSAEGLCSFVEGASNIDTFLDDNIVDYYDWTTGENMIYYLGVFYANNGWWNQAKGEYNFELGCTVDSACNYNEQALVDDASCLESDCNGECGGTVVIDCAGECNGEAVEDDCGVCDGNNNTMDCSGICDGPAIVDCTGQCGGTVIIDCAGECNGEAIEDECGVCDTDPTNDCNMDCTGEWGGNNCYQQDCDNYPTNQFDCEGDLLANDLSTLHEFKLLPNYPNPFNPTTTIKYSIETFSAVNISVYSINGGLIQTLVNSSKQSGEYSVQWNASDFPSGLYFVKLISTNERAEQKILFIK